MLLQSPHRVPGLFGSSDPICGEILDTDHLEVLARDLAGTHRVRPSGGRGRKILARVRANGKALLAAYRSTARAIAEQRAISPAAEWLVDNFHVVDEQLREIRDDLPPGFYSGLPKLTSGPLEGYPRVLALVWAYVEHTDSCFDPNSLRQFVRAYQEVEPLLIGELWAIPLWLRLLLVENLRRLADGIVQVRNDRERANALADALIGLPENTTMVTASHVLAEASPRTAVELLQRLRDKDPATTPALRALDERIAAWGTTREEVVAKEHQRQAATHVSVRNVITSMRGISAEDWPTFFESVSLVDETLHSSLAFAESDFATRDRCRASIEELGRGSGSSELAIARVASEQALTAVLTHEPGHAERLADPAYYLISSGRPAVEAIIGYRVPARQRLRRLYAQHATVAYVSTIAILTVAILAAPLAALAMSSLAPWIVPLFAVLGLVPASDLAVAIVNASVSDVVGARRLARLSLDGGIPTELRTLVAIPAMLSDEEAVRELLERLEVHYLANNDGDIHFALVTDWTDAPEASMPDDERLLSLAKGGVAELNARHDTGRFFLFHRRRLHNPGERCFMGWERKRGKLHELNRLLRGKPDTSFLEGTSFPDGVRYVITLDADTQMPRGAALRMVGAAAHPLNRPVFDERTGRVTEGHAILQPRVTPSFPSAREGTLFQRVFSGPQGTDPYAFVVFDVYQDLFGEGIYTGKGIYEIDTFERALGGRFPDNAVLSHDLIEGIVARAGYLSDVELVEAFPSHYETAARRQHRWIRGDWQLLPFIFGKSWSPAPRSLGRVSTPALAGIARFKMLDNLRRSLLAPSALLLLLVAWIWGGRTADLWTSFVLATIALPRGFAVLSGIVPARPNIAKRTHVAALLADVETAAWQAVLDVTFLAHKAYLAVDAIVRTMFRLFVSKRHLLEWTTAAQAREGVDLSLPRTYLRLLPAVTVALSASLLLSITSRGDVGMWAPLVFLWCVLPAIARASSSPHRLAVRDNLSADQRKLLAGIAEKTWTFFTTFVTAQDNFLPPDNFQEDPHPVVAHRTSPTNIGLYLLSAICAYDFKWIELGELVRRLSETLDSLRRLERFRGHFYNWYDTERLAPLDPKYISTVDSGNLAGHLVAVAQACREFAASEAGSSLTHELAAIEQTCRSLAHEMDFAFLFDPRKKLFSIGYRLSDGSLDGSYYDLLASEARLASFMAIAKGDVPTSHWQKLGRPLAPLGRGSALLSWSGSMFEYLMPELVMRDPEGSLLSQTAELVVDRQMSYARARRVPWGISESAYNARDAAMNYQYASFGVSGLGLKRGLSQNLVIAPYASALAAMVNPVAAAQNLARMDRMNAAGTYGFYESIDYTGSRLSAGQSCAIVRAYFAHHQGMTLVALANVLLDGSLRARFHSDVNVQAAELLLHERTPRSVAVARPRADEVASDLRSRDVVAPALRTFQSPHHLNPRVHVLSNGNYTVMLTAAGAGYSRARGKAITRWREDGCRAPYGVFVYLSDVDSGRVWSAGYQPTQIEPEAYEVVCSEDRVAIFRRDRAIEATTEVIVSPEDDAEVRQVSLYNVGAKEREIEVTSYVELALAGQADDEAHPAFSSMFVETEFVAGVDALLATRRPRSEHDAPLWAAHVAEVRGQRVGPVQYETSRAKFVGRGATLLQPRALDRGVALSGETGHVLSPVFALRYRLRIAAGETARVTFATLLSDSREKVLLAAQRYNVATAFERTATLAFTHAQVKLRHLGIDAEEAHVFQRLAGYLAYRSLGAPTPYVQEERVPGRTALWQYGISGDLPIIVIRIDDAHDLDVVRQMLRAHEYWRGKAFAVDVVVLNERLASYEQGLEQTLSALLRTRSAEGDKSRGSVFLLRNDLLPAVDRRGLLAAARVVLNAHEGPLADQVVRRMRADPAPKVPRRPAVALPGKLDAVGPRPMLEFDNGLGGFAKDGSEYVVVLGEGKVTPAPWINVIANETFGFQVSESGAGYTWSENSRENMLTAWSNDAVVDPPSEVFYLRDDETGEVWCPTPSPIRERSTYTVRHGFGYTTFEHESHGIYLELTQFVAPNEPVKISRLTLHNRSGRRRTLSIVAYVEWSLGNARAKSEPFVVTNLDESGALFAENQGEAEFAERTAFADLGSNLSSWTCSRREFLGPHGNLAAPVGLAPGTTLGKAAGRGLDPCAALVTSGVLLPGAMKVARFLLGQGKDRPRARDLVKKYRTEDLDACLESTRAKWNRALGGVHVRSPDRKLDIMVNGWLLYQTLACRMWARAAFYQAGGAYGFRDQLQDAMAWVLTEPRLLRSQLLRAAGRQFVEGDVQHWWHPPSGRGVRTRISDDRVWLAYGLLRYLNVTGDTSILTESVPFLSGPTLSAEQEDAYFAPSESRESASLYEHVARAVDASLATGSHGLPLMGTGDWNDGMNRVGAHGQGESVWLAWLLLATLPDFAEVAERSDDTARAARYRQAYDSLREATERGAWDGAWYRRAYFDDGSALGSHTNQECRIDSIAQSWAVLSGAATPERAQRAMQSLQEHLVKKDQGIVLLLTPPFNGQSMSPGYIAGYPPGIRENGGQYTHAATWVVMALAALGQGADACEVFGILNPIGHAASPEGVERYRVEPYVIAADVYSESAHTGRGGWTWYTGSAGWMYRAAVESILGLKVHGREMTLDPCVSPSWRSFELTYSANDTRYHVIVENPRHVARGVVRLEVDGAELHGNVVRLVDDRGTHEVRVTMG